MALATHLADTSVYARLHLEPVRGVMIPLVERGLVATCSVVDLETQYSARSFAEYEAVTDERAGFERLDIDQDTWDAAIDVQRALARQGRLRAVGIPDLLIAAVAEQHRVTVLHYDRDFEVIAEVTGQPTAWVLPAGSVS